MNNATQSSSVPTLRIHSMMGYARFCDQGRFGQQNIGASAAEPLDNTCFFWANQRLANTPNSTCIEFSGQQLVLQALSDVHLCITSEATHVYVNDRPQHTWQVLTLHKDDEVRIQSNAHGFRHYIAITGGFQAPPSLGSCATHTRLKLGPPLLHVGQILRGISPYVASIPASQIDPWHTGLLAPATHSVTLRFIPSPLLLNSVHTLQPAARLKPHDNAPRYDRLALFTQQTYQVSEAISAMGYRLSGTPLAHQLPGEVSRGTCLGMIQLPPNGQPIVLLTERQTIGGYPLLGVVIAADIRRLTQRQPGDHVCFKPVTLEDDECINALQTVKWQSLAGR